jgi:DNA-binding LacI/PurR family transcriptional regulator
VSSEEDQAGSARRGRPKTEEHYEAIARAACTTPVVVRNFFSRPGKLGADTRRRVATAVAEYGWRPATRRRGPLSGATIGYEVPRSWTAPNPIFAATFYACTLSVQRADGRVAPFVVDPQIRDYVHTAESSADQGGAHEDWLFRYGRRLAPRAYDEAFRHQQLRGFLVDDPRGDDVRLSWLDQHHVPYVVLGTPDRPGGRFYADIDDAKGFETMVQRLLDAGCSAHRIGHYGFADDSTLVPARRRKAVARALGAERNRGLRRERPYQAADDSDEVKALVVWLKQHRPDAVVCDSDAMAALVAAAAPAAGRRVNTALEQPADILLAGCDDTLIRRNAGTPWMSLRQPASQWASAATDLLADAIRGRPPRAMLIEPEVVDPPAPR